MFSSSIENCSVGELELDKSSFSFSSGKKNLKLKGDLNAAT